MPDAVAGSDAERAVIFSREIVDATAEFACAFKLNTAFFEQFGPAGVEALERTIRFIKDCHPRCVVSVETSIPSLSGCSETPRSPRVHRGGW